VRSVVVVGGTGPTGYALVELLLTAGDRVTIVHTGQHEIAFSRPVEHVHCDPRSRGDLAAALGGREFDAAISTSGRLREVVTVLSGRVGTLAAVTGLPGYVGWLAMPGRAGRPMPLRETDPPTRPLGGGPGDGLTARVLENERAVLEASARGAFRAAILRYTMVYGPYAYVPFEWYFVRRVLDGRRRLALEADGLMLPQRGYAENLATAVLLTLDDPRADGQVYNVGDEQVLSVRAIADTVAGALGHEFDVVSVPLAATPCRNPFSLRQNTLFDLGAIRGLGYRDTVPVEEATRRAARWLAQNPVGRGSPEEASLGEHAFDYAAEDHAIEVYGRALSEAGSARFFPPGAHGG
jgi:nucleoside-diphosphate-sugar epimerase